MINFSGAPLRRSASVNTFALLKNIRLGRKYFQATNTLAYFLGAKKVFNN